MKESVGKSKRIVRRIARLSGRLPGLRRSLRWRVLILVAIGLAGMLAAFAVSSLLAVNESIDSALEERRALAETTAGHVDYVLTHNLKMLNEVAFAEGFDLEDADPDPEQRALRGVYFASIFSGGMYLVDQAGRILWTEPVQSAALGTDLSAQADVADALTSGKPVISGLKNGVLSGGPVASMLSPVRSPSGQLVGLVGGDIDLAGRYLQNVILHSAPGETGYSQIVDSQGIILASTRPGDVLQTSDHESYLATLIQEERSASGTCHRCHEDGGEAGRETEVMAFSPLTSAPWGVVIRQAESEALAPARHLKERAIWLGVPGFGLALLFAWAVVSSVTRPVGVLTDAAQKIASGDLSQEVPDLGEDEIGRLAGAFETMRTKLKASLERVQAWSRELEDRVQERTRELESSRDHLQAVAEENAAIYEELKQKDAMRSELLKKVITAQEEERRRIARELHDETSQALTALVVGLETATLGPPLEKSQLEERLLGLRQLATQTLEEVHNLTYDLRPSVLDDLGLVAGLHWYAENRLHPMGVRFHLEVGGEERRLPSELEATLFRIGQEAISNIVRHAEASNVLLTVDFEENAVTVEVEDDGKGFDVDAAADPVTGPAGWGLLGMRERTALVGGTLDVSSQRSGGTRVYVRVPLGRREDTDEEDPGSHSG